MLTKPLRYDSDHDVSMRLSKTIVRYKGRPVYVTEYVDGLHVKIRNLDEGASAHLTEVHSSNVDLDITSPPTGWINGPTIPLYIARGANRQQQQGLSLNKVYVFNPRSGQIGLGYHWNSWEELIPFANMIDNKNYPSISSILDKEDSRGGAFDRDWAIHSWGHGVYTIWHKMDAVGTFKAKDKTFFFANGDLTKTRRESLNRILNSPQNQGVYFVQEQA